MAETDTQALERYKTWRDNILVALQTPETVSAFGGHPDQAGGGTGVARMPGRSQLLSELRQVEERIDALEQQIDGAFEVTSEMFA